MLGLDTPDASMALHGCCSVSSTDHSRYVRTHSACRLQVMKRQAILPSTLGFMTSAWIASSCFTRPRFELGLSSRAPEISAKQVRLSCSLKSRVLSSMHHDVLNVGLFTPHISSSPFAPVVIMLDVFDDLVVHGLLLSSGSCTLAELNEVSLSGSRRTVEWLLVRNLLPWHSMATNITSSLVQSPPAPHI